MSIKMRTTSYILSIVALTLFLDGSYAAKKVASPKKPEKPDIVTKP